MSWKKKDLLKYSKLCLFLRLCIDSFGHCSNPKRVSHKIFSGQDIMSFCTKSPRMWFEKNKLKNECWFYKSYPVEGASYLCHTSENAIRDSCLYRPYKEKLSRAEPRQTYTASAPLKTLHWFTCQSATPSRTSYLTCTGDSTFFWLSTVVSDLEKLILISAFLHSAAHHFSKSWRLRLDETNWITWGHQTEPPQYNHVKVREGSDNGQSWQSLTLPAGIELETLTPFVPHNPEAPNSELPKRHSWTPSPRL